MTQQDTDPLIQQAIADATVQRAASELRATLQRLTSALQPFPQFLGMPTIQALEIDPSGVADPERGCIVLCPDGELYELVLRAIPGTPDLGGGLDHTEEYNDPNLSPGDYVAYAHTAIRQLTKLLQEQQGNARP